MGTFLTKANLIISVETELGLVAGTGVQIYTEPQIAQKIYNGFITIADQRFWEHLTKTTYHGLDGSTGTITDDALAGVQGVEDIQWIRNSPYEKCNELIYLNTEPYETFDNRPAYDTRHWEDPDFSTKIVTIYPLDSSETIAVRARRKPSAFNSDYDTVPMDGILMTHFIAWQMLSADGINPQAADVQFSMFNQRLQTIIENKSSKILNFSQSDWSNTFTVAE